MNFQVMADLQPADGECSIYIELPNAMRQPLGTFGSRVEAMNMFHPQVKAFSLHNKVMYRLVDSMTALIYDPHDPTDATAIVYMDPAPDRRKHSGDVRINRREHPRRPVEGPQPPEDA